MSDGLFTGSDAKQYYFNGNLERPVVVESLSRSTDGKLNYQLKYVPNILDSSDYPGKVIYRRATTGHRVTEAEHGAAVPAPALGLGNGSYSPVGSVSHVLDFTNPILQAPTPPALDAYLKMKFDCHTCILESPSGGRCSALVR